MQKQSGPSNMQHLVPPCSHGKNAHSCKGIATETVRLFELQHSRDFALQLDDIPAGTLPSPLATSLSLTSLDFSSNQLTALPSEWSIGFANATQSSLQSIFLQSNQIEVIFSVVDLSVDWM